MPTIAARDSTSSRTGGRRGQGPPLTRQRHRPDRRRDAGRPGPPTRRGRTPVAGAGPVGRAGTCARNGRVQTSAGGRIRSAGPRRPARTSRGKAFAVRARRHVGGGRFSGCDSGRRGCHPGIASAVNVRRRTQPQRGREQRHRRVCDVFPGGRSHHPARHQPRFRRHPPVRPPNHRRPRRRRHPARRWRERRSRPSGRWSRRTASRSGSGTRVRAG